MPNRDDREGPLKFSLVPTKGITSSSRLMHPNKHPSLIVPTPFGISSFFKLEQSSKAYSHIVLNFLGNRIYARLVH